MKQAKRISFIALMAAFAVVGCVAPGFAGEYYLSDEPSYWWYWDGSPDFEVLIPASRPNAGASAQFAYLQSSLAGHTTLQISLGTGGPLMMIGTLPQTDPNAIFDALTAPWKASLRQSRKSTDSTIQTEQGLSARFMVLQGSGPSGPPAMIRMVAFRRGERSAYLLFVGDEASYAGDIRQYWIRAVNSFRWR